MFNDDNKIESKGNPTRVLNCSYITPPPEGRMSRPRKINYLWRDLYRRQYL